MTRGCMAYEEEGDDFGDLHAVLTPLILVLFRPNLPFPGVVPLRSLCSLPKHRLRGSPSPGTAVLSPRWGWGLRVGALLLPCRVLSLSRIEHPGTRGFSEGRTVLMVAREVIIFLNMPAFNCLL